MAMSINTNVMSLNAQRHLVSSSTKMGVSMERLASGLRINSAKDDAAGLAVSQKMLGQIKSLDRRYLHDPDRRGRHAGDPDHAAAYARTGHPGRE